MSRINPLKQRAEIIMATLFLPANQSLFNFREICFAQKHTEYTPSIVQNENKTYEDKFCILDFR